jgi:hypothetical protein
MLAERNNIDISCTEDQTGTDQQWQTDWSLQREWEAGNHGDGSCRERLCHIYIDCLELTPDIRTDILNCFHVLEERVRMIKEWKFLRRQ